jgi:hypothetical protein
MDCGPVAVWLAVAARATMTKHGHEWLSLREDANATSEL